MLEIMQEMQIIGYQNNYSQLIMVMKLRQRIIELYSGGLMKKEVMIRKSYMWLKKLNRALILLINK